MKTSESIKSLTSALVSAQKNIKAAVKDSKNPHFQSKYADIASVIEAVRIPLTDAGITFLQPVSTVEDGVSVETILIHGASGEWISESLTVPVSKNDAQGVGSAITYGRRYGLQSMCGVPAEDDDGNKAAGAPPKMQHKPTDGARDNLNPEAQQKVRKIASAALDWLNNGSVADATMTIDNADLDTDETVYLWMFFDAKQRAAMKKEHDRIKAENNAKLAATQP